MRAVITGGAGFLGSHLTDLLLAKGWAVVALDNLATGEASNVAHLGSHARFTLTHHDVTQPIELQGAVDWVLHLASPASPVDYLRLPLETLRVGSVGTEITLKLALEKKAGYLLASTSESYGDPEVHPQPEDYWGHVNPVGPRSVYDEAKRFAEALTMAYHRKHRLNTRIVRIFNTYGPRMRLEDGRALPNFLLQALTGKPLTVYGDGGQTRSLCYVSDLVEGIYRVLECADHEPINLGNPQEITMLDLAETVRRLTGSASGIEYRALPEDDPKRRCPDISKAGRLLGWRPKVGLEEGVRKTLEYVRVQVAGQDERAQGERS